MSYNVISYIIPGPIFPGGTPLCNGIDVPSKKRVINSGRSINQATFYFREMRLKKADLMLSHKAWGVHC